MSVKIYEGLAIERDLSLADLRGYAKKLRPKLDAMAQSQQTQAFASEAARGHDLALLGRLMAPDESEVEVDWSKSPMERSHRWLMARREDARLKRGDPGIPVSFEACFFAIGGGRTLAMAFGGDELKKVFAKAVGAKHYGYWDSADPQDGLTAKQWTQRRRDWEKALGKGFDLTPAEAGVTVSLLSEQFSSWWTPTGSELERAWELPEFSRRARAEWLAESICRDESVGARLKVMEDAQPRRKGDLSMYVEALREWRQDSKGAAKPRLDLCAGLIEAGLPELDVAVMRTSVEELKRQGEPLRAALADRMALDDVRSGPKEKAKPSL